MDYKYCDITTKELLNVLSEIINKNEKHNIAVLNANKIYLGDKDQSIFQFINEASVVLPENVINILNKLRGRNHKSWNMGGFTSMQNILLYSAVKNYKVFFLGAKKNTLNKMIINIEKSISPKIIAGYNHGYFNDHEINSIIADINYSSANILLLGLGSPKQEEFIIKYSKYINCNVFMGVGGSFKIYAGEDKPAPSYMKYGLEWLFRSFQDPKKFKRYIIINYHLLKKIFCSFYS